MHDLQDQATDKTFLRSIADNDYEIPDGIKPFDLARALLPNLASGDPELRDELSYMILASGLIDKHKLTATQQEELLFIVLDNQHLFYHIGEKETDSVFMRSYSALVIETLLYTDVNKQELSPDAIQQTKTALTRYAREEKDWRGYIEGKGWAHAMAHLADALDVCTQNQYMTETDRQQMLDLVCELAKLSEPLYHEEDIRLADIAYHIIAGKQVDNDFLQTWLDSCFVNRVDITSWISATNVKNFLRSLYFLILWNNLATNLLEQISEQLRRLDEYIIEVQNQG